MSVAARFLLLLSTVGVAAACTGQPVTSPPVFATPAPETRPTATTAPTAEPTSSPPPSIELVGSAPVVRPTDLGDYGAALAATYFLDNATHHAYAVGFLDTPGGGQRVFHLTSPDGESWTVDPADPFAELGLDLSRPGPIPGTVMRQDDGWVMYLWGVRSPFPSGAVLWRATADGPGGPWRADPEPILEVGEFGAWDDLGLDFPAVVEVDDGYFMLYGANGTTHRDAALIGYARSTDGITWERGPSEVLDPETCGTAENDFIAQPRLVRTDEGYLALFLAGADIAAATSPDGLEWTCLGDDTLLSGSELPSGERVHSFAAAVVDERIQLLVEALIDRGSELWLGEMALP